MLIIKIILYFTFIFNLSSCLPIETESTFTFNEYFDHTTAPIETNANITLNNNDKNTTFFTETKPKLTLDEFFDYTTFPYLRFSPTGQHLLFQTRRPSWSTDSYENSLWLYDIETQQTTLITKHLDPSVTPHWSSSGNWIAYFSKQRLHLYSIESNEVWFSQFEILISPVLAWSHNDSSIYFAVSKSLPTKDDDNLDNSEWKDVIRYRQQKERKFMSTIYRIDIEMKNYTLFISKNIIKNVSFSVSELLFIPFEEKLVLSSTSKVFENSHHFEIYLLDLQNLSSLRRLTNNTVEQTELQLSADGKNVLYRDISALYALNLTNGHIESFGKLFNGDITGYTAKSDGGVYILEQWKTDVFIFSQQSPTENLVAYPIWNGIYESIASSSNPNCSIAFVYSSSDRPMEVYCTNNISDRSSTRAITSENQLFTQRNLPQTKVYHWTNKDDHEVIDIEGILHYPPGKFESKNLPLLVLIHGGPNSASLNKLEGNYYNWAPLAASEGWLVLEPNYRGSTGYGDKFSTQLRRKPLTLAGRDILSGVDQLIKDGIADPYRLAVGGCSYGGSLTNWLMTQTKRFNAALSCSGTVEPVSDWGTMDDPSFYTNWFGGLPWETPHIYQNEAPMYQLDRVRTPTHICTGEKDERVPASQSYILERGLHSRGIPADLIIFPNEGHSFDNPWYGKIKVREELKWLKKYGEGEN